jgi:ubiquinol-cytochrome c reductase cytochrome b subunit
VPFWPDAAWRDLFFGCVVVLVIFLLAVIVGPPEIGKPPDPTIIQASPRPDWYFLWYFALLALIPNWSETIVIVAVPLIFVIFLVALPLVAGNGERSPIRRPWSIVLVIFLVATIGYYWHQGMTAPWSPHMDAPPLPESVVGVSSGPIADGAKIFYEKGCEFCHLVSGYGGIRGPDLSDAGDRMTRAEMITRIYSGAANMPSYSNNLKPDELNTLLAFLQSRHRAYKYKI